MEICSDSIFQFVVLAILAGEALHASFATTACPRPPPPKAAFKSSGNFIGFACKVIQVKYSQYNKSLTFHLEEILCSTYLITIKYPSSFIAILQANLDPMRNHWDMKQTILIHIGIVYYTANEAVLIPGLKKGCSFLDTFESRASR